MRLLSPLSLLPLLPLLTPSTLAQQSSPSPSPSSPSLLVYSRTAGYRHDSIPVATSALQQIADQTSLYVPTFSEDPSIFTTEGLEGFKAIVFLSNSDQVLTSDGEKAFEEWLTKGGSLVGLHAATACLFEDQTFGTAMGSWFHRHPDIQNVTFTKLINHETIDMLPDRYETFEEIYSFRTDPRSVNATILLSVDPSTYIDPSKPTESGIDAPYYQGTPHPIAWFREGGMDVDLSNGTYTGEGQGSRMNGRMWMTSLGHTNETWRSDLHLQHVEAGLRWALADFSSSNSSTSPSSSPTTSSSTESPTSSTPTNASENRIHGFSTFFLLFFAGFILCNLSS